MAHSSTSNGEDDLHEQLLERRTANAVEKAFSKRLYALDTELSPSPNGATLSVAFPGDNEPTPADSGRPLVEVMAHIFGDGHDTGGVSRNVTADVIDDNVEQVQRRFN